ncbi:MAG: hypothetical protein QXK70_05605 [Archaeoglobaceae archaeon]
MIKRKKWYSIGLSMFMYFGTIFIAFFGCLLFPSILFMKPYFVSNPPTLTALDKVFFSPAFPAAKLLLVFIVALLPALYYTRGFGFSLIITALPGIVAWHYICVAAKLEKLDVAVENFNPWIAPFGLLDGILVVVPALSVGTLIVLALENEEPVALKQVLKLVSIPAALSIILSVIQWGYIF